MSKIALYLIIVLLIGLVSVVSGQEPQSESHFFNEETWETNNSCITCHVGEPGNEPGNIEKAVPLPWNKRDTTNTYQVYSSNSLNSYTHQPSGSSKLCLSCHDGTVGSDKHVIGILGGSYKLSSGNFSIDLNNSHPISFVYDASLAIADNGLYDPSTTMSGLGGTIAEDLLENGRMECISCHDVHSMRKHGDFENIDAAERSGHLSGTFNSLRKSNEHSALCLTCHNK